MNFPLPVTFRGRIGGQMRRAEDGAAAGFAGASESRCIGDTVRSLSTRSARVGRKRPLALRRIGEVPSEMTAVDD